MQITLQRSIANRAYQLRLTGRSYDNIATELGTSLSTAYRACKAMERHVSRQNTAINNTKTNADAEVMVRGMRSLGYTYESIGKALSIPHSRVWRICNRERSREHARSSSNRYRNRNYTAIADIKPKKVWLAMNYCK